MFRRTMAGRMALAVAALAAGAGLLATPAAAHDGKGKGKKELHGTLTAVDAVAGTLTITNKAGVATALAVTATTKYERNEKKAALADFKVGDKVEACLDAAGAVRKLEGSGSIVPG